MLHHYYHIIQPNKATFLQTLKF